MKKTDLLGEYETNEVRFQPPFKLDEEQGQIVDSNNLIVGVYTVAEDNVQRGMSRRNAEFFVRIANGEIAVDKTGKLFHRVSAQYQEGAIVVRYA